MSDLPDSAVDVCMNYFPEVSASFVRRKEFGYSWRCTGKSIQIGISDYLDGAPDQVVSDYSEMICRRAKRLPWSVPESYLEFVCGDEYIVSRRPVYIARSRNLSRSVTGEHADLTDSVQRLLDMGLLAPSDIDNSYISWTRRDTRRRVGFCSTMFRVVGISAALDSDSVPDYARDYVVYHECLHLRQRYRPDNRTHDRQFRAWERAYPQWSEAEAVLKRL